MSPSRIRSVVAPLLLLALVPGAPAAAFAAWATTGNVVANTTRLEQPDYLESYSGTPVCPDGGGGMFVAYTIPFVGMNYDSLRLNRVDGATGARQWGTLGVLINGTIGRANGPAHVVSDLHGGCWAAWSDSRTGALGVYVQRFDANGVPQLAANGQRVNSTAGSLGTSDLDVAVTPSGRLMVAYFENGIGLKVQRIALTGGISFGPNGAQVTTDSSPFAVQLMADGEGAMITWESSRASLPGTGHAKIVGNRIGPNGLVRWGAEGAVIQAGAAQVALEHRSVWDGSNLFVCWNHAGTTPGLHAQRVDTSGVAHWATTTTGLAVAPFPNTAWDRYSTVLPFPRVVSDDAGGAIVIWTDARDYDRPGPNGFPHGQDIYGTRLNGSGTGVWGGPVAFDSTTGTQDQVQACTDSSGGVIVAYRDLALSAGISEDDIHARRIGTAGTSVWQSFLNKGIPADGEQLRPVLAADLRGGACFAWEDHRDDTGGGSNGSDVYVTHRTLGGSLAAPGLTVTFPNGGEMLQGLQPVALTWTSTLGGDVKLEFSSGSFVRQLITASTPDDGSFTWTAPDGGSGMKLYVSDALTGAPADSSNATFSICGPLSPAALYGTASAANDLTSADLNADGMLDIAVAAQSGVVVQFGLGSGGVGNGAFGPPQLYATPTSAQDVVAGDFNGDGVLDLVASVSGGGVRLLPGNAPGGTPDGTFGAQTAFAAGLGTRGLQALDFDHDGILDLVAVNGTSNTISFLRGQGVGGVGDGTFAAPVDAAVGSNPSRVAVADFNADGRFDLAVTNNSSNSVTVLLGAGDGGSFVAQVPTYPAGAGPIGIVTGDFNHDGITDLAVSDAGAPSGFTTLLGAGSGGVGDGTFHAPVGYAVGSNCRDVTALDLDGDGITDLLGSIQNTDQVVALFGNGPGSSGDGTFTLGGFEAAGNGPSQLIVADFLEDGVPDAASGVAIGSDLAVMPGHCGTALSTALQVLSPNGGESFDVNSVHTIGWSKGAGVIAVDLDLSRDGGAHWETIARNLTGTSFAWTVSPRSTANARVRVRDSQVAGRQDASDAGFVILDSSVDVGDAPPAALSFSRPWPNPAHASVFFTLALPSAARMSVQVYDVHGRVVATLLDGPVGAGVHTMRWDSAAGHAGVYFVRARGPAFDQVRRVVRID